MISRLRGTLLSRGGTGIEIATAGGTVYEVDVPISVAERLPPMGEEMEIRTVHVVREDLMALYGFLEVGERQLFQILLGASGVGAKLALAMMSTYSASRLARALAERDVGALVQVPGVGKKTAERLALELGDRAEVIDMRSEATAPGVSGGAHDAVTALVSLGMSFQDADRAVRIVLENDAELETEILIRRALALK